MVQFDSLASGFQSRPAFFDDIVMALKSQIYEQRCPLAASAVDLLSTFVYSDDHLLVDHSKLGADSEVQILFPAGSRAKTWLVGDTLVTLQVGRMGWARLIVRRASGITTWLCQIESNLKQYVVILVLLLLPRGFIADDHVVVVLESQSVVRSDCRWSDHARRHRSVAVPQVSNRAPSRPVTCARPPFDKRSPNFDRVKAHRPKTNWRCLLLPPPLRPRHLDR